MRGVHKPSAFRRSTGLPGRRRSVSAPDPSGTGEVPSSPSLAVSVERVAASVSADAVADYLAVHYWFFL